MRRQLDKRKMAERLIEEVERANASIRAKAERPFRANKRQFGLVKIRCEESAENTAHPITLFDLGNLWIVRARLQQPQG